jgi:hypothetical protein
MKVLLVKGIGSQVVLVLCYGHLYKQISVFRITGFLDFVHCPVFWKLENTTFQKVDLFLSSPEDLRTETDPVSEKLFFLVFRIPDNEQTPQTQ